MEHSYSDIVSRLTDAFSELTPQLQKAARFMIEQPEEVGVSSMRSIARSAGVKPATISRLSRSLGFSGYEQLREPFRQRLRRPDPGYAMRLRDVQKRGTDDIRALFEDVRSQNLGNIKYTLSDDSYPVLLEAAKTIESSRRVYVLGLRGAYSAAFLFHYTYQLFRDNSQLLDTVAGIFADQLRGIGEDDCMLVISFPPYTRLTIDAVGYAADAGVKIIAITNNSLSPVAQAARHTIVTRHNSASFYQSFTAAVAVNEALITLLVSQTDSDAVKIVEQAEEQLSRISAYW